MALSTTQPGEGLCLMHRFVDRLIGNGECVAGGLTYLAGLLDAKYLWFVKSRHKKTTRRWFRDTAYCFDCSMRVISQEQTRYEVKQAPDNIKRKD